MQSKVYGKHESARFISDLLLITNLTRFEVKEISAAKTGPAEISIYENGALVVALGSGVEAEEAAQTFVANILESNN